MDKLVEEDTYGHLLLLMVMVTHITNNLPVAAPTLDTIGHSPPQIMWVTTISVIVTLSILIQEMPMMIYGMGKDVVQVVVAVNGTSHLTSASTSTTPHPRTWKLDSSRIIISPLCLS